MLNVKDQRNNSIKNIPIELKELKQWVLTPYEGKAPVTPQNRFASSTSPLNWYNFDTVDIYLEHDIIHGGNKYKGFTFAPTKDTPYIVIDIDNCISIDSDTGEVIVHDLAEQIVDDLQTYTEISQSGTGLHLIVKYTGNPFDKGYVGKHYDWISGEPEKGQIHLEMFSYGHFCGLTGNLFDPDLKDIKEDNEYIDGIYAELNDNHKISSEMSTNKYLEHLQGVPLSDDAVLKKLSKAKNKDKFNRLFNETDAASKTGKCESEDDVALAGMILFYCGNEHGRDLKQCERIMHQSPRFQPENRKKIRSEKNHSPDRIISLAVNEAYRKRIEKIQSGKPEPVYKAPNQKPIDVYADGRKLTGKDDHKKESGVPNQPSIYSLFFDLDKHGNYILSTFKHEKFAFYLIEKYHIIRINKQLHIYKDGIYEYSEDLIESLMIDLIPVLKISHRKETLSIIRLKAPERTDDIKPEYMAYKNGVLNILTMDLLPFTPDLTLTYKIPFNYNPNAVCETASKALREIADNNDKRERLLKEVFGYCLYPSCEFEKMFVFMGTDGANGKSTILEWFKYSIGKSNYATVKPQDFSNRFSNISQYHKLANIMDDVSSASMDDTASATMRNLVSGNEIDVEQKGQPRFRMAPVATQIMACNKIPKFGRESYSATLRRLIIVDFPAEFSQEKGNVDVHLKQKLSTDAAAEWLIKESVQAFHDLLTRTDNHMIFTECAQDRYLLMDYKKDNDTFFGWIDYLMDTLETTDLASWFIGRQVKECHRNYLAYMREEMTGSDFVRLSLPNFSKRVQHEFRLTTHRPKVNGVKVSTFKSK